MWLKVYGFIDMVKGWRGSYQFHGMPSLFCLINSRQRGLEKWNETDFGNIVCDKSFSSTIDGLLGVGILEAYY